MTDDQTTTDDDDRQHEAAHRLADLLERVLARAQTEFGLSTGAIATALIGAGVRAARADMPAGTIADWLRDVAGEVEREGEAHDTVGSA